ncbi:hypothetical protein KSP39_PZI003501 [Platanthera zijinensis]|uniref:Uncharacterized protein n=1 Tax=Platanthera zijinensis TaxID=2320716 RepID=A0AAP0BWP7_9ASPA
MRKKACNKLRLAWSFCSGDFGRKFCHNRMFGMTTGMTAAKEKLVLNITLNEARSLRSDVHELRYL